MAFEKQKAQALNNYNASASCGDLDMQMKPLLDSINSLKHFYTTSSCIGRIVLIEDKGGKGNINTLGKWHYKPAINEFFKVLKPNEGILWFKYESPIMHVVAKTIDSAKALMDVCRHSGFKRSGIQSVKTERILCEILSTEKIDVPLGENGEIHVSFDYLRFLLKQGGGKFDISQNKLKKLHEKILKTF